MVGTTGTRTEIASMQPYHAVSPSESTSMQPILPSTLPPSLTRNMLMRPYQTSPIKRREDERTHMLPDIYPQYGDVSGVSQGRCKRSILIGRWLDGQSALRRHGQPGPAGAKHALRNCCEVGLEGIKASECVCELFHKLGRWCR